HGTTTLFHCDICTSEFRRRHDLNRHKRTRHTNLRPYACTIAGQRFQEPMRLKKHL
ncbi:hypothetical protein BC829DRAFT_358671, partial [Chytridium lagenaria]